MVDRFFLRHALDTDSVALSQLSQQTFRETYIEDFAIPYSEHDIEYYFHSKKSPEWYASKISDPLQATWVVEDKVTDELVAFAIVCSCKLPHPDVCSGEDGELQFLYVRRDRRSHGLGQRLLNTALFWLEERFRGRPVWLGVLSCNLKAHNLYKH
jgi:GNAT superfamily N-acetyltransferase